MSSYLATDCKAPNKQKPCTLSLLSCVAIEFLQGGFLHTELQCISLDSNSNSDS